MNTLRKLRIRNSKRTDCNNKFNFILFLIGFVKSDININKKNSTENKFQDVRQLVASQIYKTSKHKNKYSNRIKILMQIRIN